MELIFFELRVIFIENFLSTFLLFVQAKEELNPTVTNERKAPRPQTAKPSVREEIQEILSKPEKGAVYQFEFGGPIGALFIMLHLPLVVLVVNQLCNQVSSQNIIYCCLISISKTVKRNDKIFFL